MEKLKNELSGILAWMVKGAQLYLHGGLIVSTASRALKLDMHEEGDEVQQWIDAELVQDAGSGLSSSAGYQAYRSWEEKRGMNPKSIQAWSSELKRKGYVNNPKNSRGCMTWKGLRRRDTAPASTSLPTHANGPATLITPHGAHDRSLTDGVFLTPPGRNIII